MDPVDAVRQPAVVGELLAGRALGDHGADPRVRADRGQGLLTAHRLAEHGDLAGVDAGLPGQERHGGGHVPVTPPAEVHRVPAGAAVAAAIDQQRPVAVPGQHRGLAEHRGAGGPGAGQQHHGGAVARRDVPGRQPHPVSGAERHILVGEPVLRGGGGSQRPGRDGWSRRPLRSAATARTTAAPGPPEWPAAATSPASPGPARRPPRSSRTRPVASTMAASTAAASSPALARWALATPAPAAVPAIPSSNAAVPWPARPARRVNQTASAVTASITRTRAACHTAEPSSPSSTAKATPSAAITAGSTAGDRGRGRTCSLRGCGRTSVSLPVITAHLQVSTCRPCAPPPVRTVQAQPHDASLLSVRRDSRFLDYAATADRLRAQWPWLARRSDPGGRTLVSRTRWSARR